MPHRRVRRSMSSSENPMTKLLEKAFREASKLPADQQDAIAASVLAELASERVWDEAFSESEEVLSALADDALAEHRDGATQPLRTDAL